MFPIGGYKVDEDGDKLSTIYLNDNQISRVLREQVAIFINKFSVAYCSGQGDEYPYLRLQDGGILRGMDMFSVISKYVGMIGITPHYKAEVKVV